MIKNASDVLKSASVAMERAEASENKLVERAGKALRSKGARKIAFYMMTHPREPFGKVTLVSVDTLRSAVAGALGSSAHKAVDRHWSEHGLQQRLEAPLLKLLHDKGYEARIAMEDHTYTSEESGNTHGGYRLTLEWWPKSDIPGA